MNDLPRRKLIEIVQRHGKSVIENPRRTEGLFRDNFGEFRREISVLIMALEENVAHDLAAARNAPRTILLARLSQRLIDNLALSAEAAKWSVHSWALALEVVSESELTALEAENEAAALPPVAVAPLDPAAARSQSPPHKAAVQSSAQIIVSAGGDGDFVSISEAIEAAADGSQILVRPGFYRESLLINKRLEIIGDGAAQKVIIESHDSSCVELQTGSAIIRNLTLRRVANQAGAKSFGVDVSGGELTIRDCNISSDSLACVGVRGQTAGVLMKNCSIHRGADAGIYFSDSAIGIIEECEIFENRGANVVITEKANPTFKNCRIFDGKTAGFFDDRNGLGTIDDCEIFGHAGVEVAAANGGSPVLRGCAIYNSMNSGVSVRDGGSALLENCRVFDNADAGIEVDGASIIAVKTCQINRNGCVAIRVKGESSARVENSDLRGNNLATWETEHGVFIENNNNLEY